MPAVMAPSPTTQTTLCSLLQLLTRLDHPVGRGDAGSRMACIERIVDAFFTFA